MAGNHAEIKIRAVIPSDRQAWLRMRLALWPDSTAEDEVVEVDRYLAGYPSPTLMAAFVCEDLVGGIIGLVEVSIKESAPGCETNRIGYLEAWYVNEEWRGRGIGRTLAERAEAWARAAGCLEMASDTTPFYPSSPAAHAAAGYVEVERYFRKTLEEEPGNDQAKNRTSRA